MLRKLIDGALRILVQEGDDPRLLDHAPLRPEDPVVETPRAAPAPLRDRLATARARYGKAFKCASSDLDREVMVVPGVLRVAEARGTASRTTVSAADREVGSWGREFVSAGPFFVPAGTIDVVQFRQRRGG